MTTGMELLRSASRVCLPHQVYLRVASRFGDALSLLRLGPLAYNQLRGARDGRPASGELTLHPPGLAHPVVVRSGTSDALVFENNLVRRSYACVAPRQPPGFIIDAGANVGYASAYFLNAYPDARVVALESESGNAAVARRNLVPYGDRVTLVEAGLWPRPARLRVQAAGRADSARVEEARDGEPWDCVAIDPVTLLTRFSQHTIDLLKCDIEGAEEQLFGVDPDPWLERTGCIVAEIHGEAARSVVYAATARHAFRSRRSRDLHVFERPGSRPW